MRATVDLQFRASPEGAEVAPRAARAAAFDPPGIARPVPTPPESRP